jgi:hypothetical protein
MGVGTHSVVGEEAISVQLKGLADRRPLRADGSKQLFPLTFKGNSTISNSTERERCAHSGLKYHNDERNQ